jgi:biotin carboxyl carrier protein
MKFQIQIDEHILDFSAKIVNENPVISLNGSPVNADCVQLSPNSYSLILDGQTHYLTIQDSGNMFEVTVDQHTNFVRVKDENALLMEKFGFSNSQGDDAGEIHVQIPGLVSKIYVNVGDEIEIGQKLFILEAMKMENEIDSIVQGTVKHIYVDVGQTVEKGDLVMELDV